MEILKTLAACLLPPTALAALAAWRSALTPGGLALAWVLAAVICYCGGLAAFWPLCATFIFTVAAGKLSGRGRERLEQRLHRKTGPRDATQIACNVLVGTVALVVYRLGGGVAFLWAYGGAMAASLADSMASELGVLSRRAPVDILTRKPLEKGLSGGVSALGTGCSLLGAAIIGGVSALCTGSGLAMFAAVTASGFLAALCDSILGSALQAKYRCGVCGVLSEKPRHCGQPGTVERGLPWLDNDGVNLLNNLIGALAALGLYFLQ